MPGTPHSKPTAPTQTGSGAPTTNTSSTHSNYARLRNVVDAVQDRDSDASSTEGSETLHAAKRSRRGQPSHAQSARRTPQYFADLTDDDLAFMDYKELVRLMSAAGLTRQQVDDTKAQRRRLKNRQSARTSSNKKRELCSDLLEDRIRLEEQLRGLQAAHEKLQRDYDCLRQQYAAVVQARRVRGE